MHSSGDRGLLDCGQIGGIDICRGMATLAERYDGFLLDLWGVLHDGEAVYSGVLHALARLKAYGRPLVAVSNAPHREHLVIAKLAGMGIEPSLLSGALTSGDLVHAELRNRTDPDFGALGRSYLLIGLDMHEALADGPGFRRVDEPADADFVLNTGPKEIHETVEDHEALLDACAARGLPMVCANPDRGVVLEGRLLVCGGALADRYRALGGSVVARGKPEPAIYRAAVKRLGRLPLERIAVVGDSMDTDIRGAANAGLDSVLVASGMHATELAGPADGGIDPAALDRLAARHGLRPTAAIPSFVW
jgi:HAD superfamily hydrolase (TIGR01459 family)